MSTNTTPWTMLDRLFLIAMAALIYGTACLAIAQVI